jgi:collagenase-like PrtC family protease
MDAIYFGEKAETCLRLAKGLSWNNPARAELMDLADEFQRQAKELDTCAEQPPTMRDPR